MKYLILVLLVGCSKTKTFELKEWNISCSKTRVLVIERCVSSSSFLDVLVPKVHANEFDSPFNPVSPSSPLNPIHDDEPCTKQEIKKEICIEYTMSKKDTDTWRKEDELP